MAIAVIAMLGAGMLALSMPSMGSGAAPVPQVRAMAAGTVTDRAILYSTAITALAYTGSFTGFTYVSVLLERQTHLGAAGITAMFTLYGVAAAVGNALGGRFMDRVGARQASLSVLGTLALALAGAWAFAGSAAAMGAVMVAWGAASFGAVPVLQTAVLLAAKRNPATSPEIASGMNIAAFNLGITAGSAIGGYVSLASVQMPMLAGLVPLAAGAAMAWRLPGRPATGRTAAAR
jgi:predicted MFS family arabinose efflux permease